MTEIWDVMEFNSIKVSNPTQTGGEVKIVPRLDPLYVKSHHKTFQLKRLRNGRDMGCYGI